MTRRKSPPKEADYPLEAARTAPHWRRQIFGLIGRSAVTVGLVLARPRRKASRGEPVPGSEVEG